MSAPSAAERRADRPARTRRLEELGRFVDHRVSELQTSYLKQRADATATLARLRRGVGKDVGALPDLWQVTLDGLPMPFEPHDDTPTYGERAAYTAITFYALHQQSRREPMHKPGQGFGTATRILSTLSRTEVAVRRRFEAVGTATTFPEAVHHTRGLITQFRGLGIGLDYGALADQLLLLQIPGRVNQVLLAWGRDYYRRPADTPDDVPTAAAEAASTPEEDS